MPECVHHWRFGEPDGPVSIGTVHERPRMARKARA